ELRQQIVSGKLPPGTELPTERELAASHNMSRDAARQALAALRGEGLVVTRQGSVWKVPEEHERQVVLLPPGAGMRSRMPTPDDRAKFGLHEGVPVIVVETGTTVTLYPGDRTMVRAT